MANEKRGFFASLLKRFPLKKSTLSAEEEEGRISLAGGGVSGAKQSSSASGATATQLSSGIQLQGNRLFNPAIEKEFQASFGFFKFRFTANSKAKNLLKWRQEADEIRQRLAQSGQSKNNRMSEVEKTNLFSRAFTINKCIDVYLDNNKSVRGPYGVMQVKNPSLEQVTDNNSLSGNPPRPSSRQISAIILRQNSKLLADQEQSTNDLARPLSVADAVDTQAPVSSNPLLTPEPVSVKGYVRVKDATTLQARANNINEDDYNKFEYDDVEEAYRKAAAANVLTPQEQQEMEDDARKLREAEEFEREERYRQAAARNELTPEEQREMDEEVERRREADALEQEHRNRILDVENWDEPLSGQAHSANKVASGGDRQSNTTSPAAQSNNDSRESTDASLLGRHMEKTLRQSYDSISGRQSQHSSERSSNSNSQASDSDSDLSSGSEKGSHSPKSP